MSERRYPLSDRKAETLRRQGIYTRSDNLLTAAVLVGATLGCAAFLRGFNFSELLREISQQRWEALGHVGNFVAAVFLPVLLLVFIASGFQSRFSFGSVWGQDFPRSMPQSVGWQLTKLVGGAGILIAVVFIALAFMKFEASGWQRRRYIRSPGRKRWLLQNHAVREIRQAIVPLYRLKCGSTGCPDQFGRSSVS